MPRAHIINNGATRVFVNVLHNINATAANAFVSFLSKQLNAQLKRSNLKSGCSF